MGTPDTKPIVGRKASLLIGAGLVMLGGVGWVWCFIRHICRDGHMRHPPYPGWHLALDGCWALAWILGAGLLFLGPSRVRRGFAVLVLLLLGFRFALGSLGGLIPFF